MNTPLAMLISGSVLAQLDLSATLKKLIKGRLLLVVLLRGVISPAIFALLLRFISIDEQMRVASVITAACPTGAFTITLSILYGRDDTYGTEILCTSTLLSIITIPLCMMIAG
jgi:predicted permease